MEKIFNKNLQLISYKDDKEDDTVLKLSDAFPKELQGVTSDVEVTTRMLNTNKDHNKNLMKACKPLSEYAWFIDRIRTLSEDHEIEESVDSAINEMPDDYLLKSFLIGNKAEGANRPVDDCYARTTVERRKGYVYHRI